MTTTIPAEFAIGGVYVPPLLIAGTLGILGSVVTARLLNRFRLSQYFFYPPVVFVALSIIYTAVFGALVVPF